LVGTLLQQAKTKWMSNRGFPVHQSYCGAKMNKKSGKTVAVHFDLLERQNSSSGLSWMMPHGACIG
jgi:hypothetical protein